MPYLFSLPTLNAIQNGLCSASISHNKTQGQDRCWSRFFFKFINSVEAIPDECNGNSVIDIIFAGDKSLTDEYKNNIPELLSVQAGLRWTGSSEGNDRVCIRGVAIKFCSANVVNNEIINNFFNVTIPVFIEKKLLLAADVASFKHKLAASLKGVTPLLRLNSLKPCKHVPAKPIVSINLEVVKHYILTNITSVLPKYRRPSEQGINPAYQNITQVCRQLQLEQKLIWLLRSDGILAVGVKNSYWVSFGEVELRSAIDDSLHPYIDWDDRYGHPSLSLPDENYDGSALYGGYICQKQDYLQVFTSSGRYYRADLGLEKKAVLEAYISLQLQLAYGKQDVIFAEGPYKDYYELSLFFTNKQFPPTVTERKYTLSKSLHILKQYVAFCRNDEDSFCSPNVKVNQKAGL